MHLALVDVDPNRNPGAVVEGIFEGVRALGQRRISGVDGSAALSWMCCI